MVVRTRETNGLRLQIGRTSLHLPSQRGDRSSCHSWDSKPTCIGEHVVAWVDFIENLGWVKARSHPSKIGGCHPREWRWEKVGLLVFPAPVPMSLVSNVRNRAKVTAITLKKLCIQVAQLVGCGAVCFERLNDSINALYLFRANLVKKFTQFSAWHLQLHKA